MQRKNGVPLQVRLASSNHDPQYLGRLTCITCGRLVPRGSDRPFCFDHAEYAQRLIKQIDAMERKGGKRTKAA